MNVSDDKVFEDTIENLEIKVHITAIMPFKPKSATRSKTTYKTLCTNRIRDVNDAINPIRTEAVSPRRSATINACHINMNERIGLFFLDFSS